MKVPKQVKEIPWPEEPATENTLINFTMHFSWPVVDHEQLLVITFQRNPLKRTWNPTGPDFRVVLSKKEGRAGILRKGSSRGQLTELWRLLHGWGTSATSCYPNISLGDEKRLKQWLGIRKTDNHCLPELEDWIDTAVSRERLAIADARGELRDEDVDLCPEELPDGLIPYIRQTVLKDDKVLIYKKGNVRSTCFCCGEKVRADVGQRFRQSEQTYCPLCKAEVIAYLEGSDRFKVDYVQNIGTLQPGTDGKTVFLRLWHLVRDDTAQWEDIPGQLQEVARWAIRGNRVAKWQLEAKHTYWMQSWRESLSTWTRVPNVVDVYDGEFVFYLPMNWKSLVAGTGLQYIEMEEYCNEKGRWKNTIRFALDWARYPAVEKLWKAGYKELVRNKINGTCDAGRAIRWGRLTIPEAVGVPLSLLKVRDPEKWTVEKLKQAKSVYTEMEEGRVSFAEARLLVENGVKPDVIRNALGHASVRKILRYLDERVAAEKAEQDRQEAAAEARGHYYYRQPEAEAYITYRDYLAECVQLGLCLDDEQVLFPRDLQAAHKRTTEMVKYRADKAKQEAFRQANKRLEKMAMEDQGLLIRPAKSAKELIAEGKTLHHCVGGYANRMAEGKVAIFFIRKSDAPDVPFFTLEYTDGKVVQCKTMHNGDFRKNAEVSAFVDKWARWVKNGCKKRKAARVA